MALEHTPASIESDGTLRIWFVPEGQDPRSAAVLNGNLAKSITYSMIPGGYARTTTEETVADERLSLKQMLERPGTVGESLEVQYVFGDAGDIASAALKQGTKGFIVARYAVPNETDAAEGQVVDILPIICGKQRKNQPTRNGVWSKIQKLFITGAVQDDTTLTT